MKILRLILTAILLAAGLTTGRACDLCGCFTRLQHDVENGIVGFSVVGEDGLGPLARNSLGLGHFRRVESKFQIRPASTRTVPSPNSSPVINHQPVPLQTERSADLSRV